MKPYLLVTGDFVETGGMDRANFALASHLADKGNEVHLVTHRAAKDLAAHPNIRLHRVLRPMNSRLLGEPLLDRAGRAWAASLAARDGRIVVNGGNCRWGDVNWVHYVHAAYTPRAFGSRLYGLKTRLAHRRALEAERATLARARIIVCNSQRTRADVIERIGVPESRIEVIYYGGDPEQFGLVTAAERARAKAALGFQADKPLVAFIGALGDRRKGFDTLFAAWQILCKRQGWDSDLVVIGAGAELPLWQQRAKDNKLTGRIRFLGFRDDVAEVLAACDALAHPARYEAYGLGVREAISRGLPALVSASAGIAEHYPAELHELLIPNPDDATDLSDRLWNWRRNMESVRERVAVMSQALRAHTWEAMAAQIVRLVEAAR